MKLNIVTPKQSITDEKVEQVIVESSGGSMGILPDHMPVLAEIKASPLLFDSGGKREYVAIMDGVMMVLNNTITIVCDDAEKAVEIDELKARKEKEDAEAYLTKKTEVEETIKAEVQLQRALARLRTVEVSKRQ